jgi:hypothetical protein
MDGMDRIRRIRCSWHAFITLEQLILSISTSELNFILRQLPLLKSAVVCVVSPCKRLAFRWNISLSSEDCRLFLSCLILLTRRRRRYVPPKGRGPSKLHVLGVTKQKIGLNQRRGIFKSSVSSAGLLQIPHIYEYIYIYIYIYLENLAHWREERLYYKMFVGRSERNRPLRKHRLSGRIILKSTWKRQGGALWTALIWVRIRTIEHGTEPLDFIE